MRITVIGTGYVGLVTGVCLAETGNEVCCLDIDEKKLSLLQKGISPIYESGIEVLLQRNIRQGRIRFTSQMKIAVPDAEVIFLALPTPPGEDGSADLSYVIHAVKDLSQHIKNYTVIVNKSTVPVGTAGTVNKMLSNKIDVKLFDIVSNPEFLKEGVAVSDFMKPERIVIGCESERATKVMRQLYEPYVRQGNPIITMGVESAELTKYAANAFLATKISFMNEIANLCEKVGANVDEVRKGIGTDSRIGKRFLFPGVGYGGSCFPKDVRALYQLAHSHDYDFKILEAVMSVNDDQKLVLVRKIKSVLGQNLTGKTIGIWGLSFKPNTDDVREAPAAYIINALINSGAEIKAYDPEAMNNMKKLLKHPIKYCQDQYQAIEDADALVIITEWNVFRTPDYEKLKACLKTPLIFDGRNVFSLEHIRELGFDYHSMGRL